MRRKWLLAVAVTVVTGCAAMGGQRARIREIQAGDAPRCKYVGVVENTERSGWSMSDDELGAMPAIRKRVSELGGNAFVLTHGPPNSYGPSLQADVYRCP